MDKKKLSVLAMPVFFLLLGIYIIVSSNAMSTSEGTFPSMVGWLTVLVSVVQLYNDIRRKDCKNVFANSNMLKVVEAAAILFAYVLLLEKIGYIVDTILLAAVTMWFLNYKNVKAILISSIGFTLIVYGIFKILLKVPLPTSILNL